MSYDDALRQACEDVLEHIKIHIRRESLGDVNYLLVRDVLLAFAKAQREAGV